MVIGPSPVDNRYDTGSDVKHLAKKKGSKKKKQEETPQEEEELICEPKPTKKTLREKLKVSLGISFVKSITWRIIASLTTTTLVFIATGKLDWALGVGVADVIIKLILYFIHERVWEWGRKFIEK